MRITYLLPVAFLALAGCVNVHPNPTPSATVVEPTPAPATTYVAPAQPTTTTVVRTP